MHNESTAKQHAMAAQALSGLADQQLSTLRTLLCGEEYFRLQDVARQLSDDQARQEYFADVIAEAIAIRSARDSDVADSLAPMITDSIHSSIRNDPESVSEALYPVMGPAIRKSIAETIQTLFDGFNKALEDSLSLRSLGWRLDAWRTGKSYPEVVLLKTLNYRVEQAFLIHKETGLLIAEVAQDLGVSKDADMMSAMLTAIQDFVSDSFDVEDGDRLHSMKMGSLTILIEPGPYAVLAVAVRGSVSSDYRALLSQTLEQCHRKYSSSLRRFSGESKGFIGLESVLRGCLKEDVQKKKKSGGVPVYGLMGLIVLLAGLGWWSYESYLNQRAWYAFVEKLDAQPGVLVQQANMSKHRILALRDPDANSRSLEQEATASGYRIRWQDYISTDDDILEKRLTSMLNNALTISVTDGIVSPSGQIQRADIETLKRSLSFMPGIKRLDLSGLQVTDMQERYRLQDQILSFRVYYGVGRAQLTNEQQDRLQALVLGIRALADLLDPATESLKIRVIGFSDEIGNKISQRRISLKRAEGLKQYLIQYGIPSRLLTAEAGDSDTLSDIAMDERRQSSLEVDITSVDKLRALQ